MWNVIKVLSVGNKGGILYIKFMFILKFCEFGLLVCI